ncbi:unnamed protein product [Mesocestoides corti]|uniref:E3 ubiquitin-protein ligase Hakai n=1 Tax=Mesocestoides corti TaxID=53468 RepID=A0A0R3U3V3_MESCO|nr:unnamed protein product [Mesocestoides corti]
MKVGGNPMQLALIDAVTHVVTVAVLRRPTAAVAQGQRKAITNEGIAVKGEGSKVEVGVALSAQAIHARPRVQVHVWIVGEKPKDLTFHICDICDKPIIVYGRLKPCNHVFCFTCASTLPGTCHSCVAKVGIAPTYAHDTTDANDCVEANKQAAMGLSGARAAVGIRPCANRHPLVECLDDSDSAESPQFVYASIRRLFPHRPAIFWCKKAYTSCDRCMLGGIFQCAEGTVCRRTYLSQRDLQAHIDHRHKPKAAPASVPTTKPTHAPVIFPTQPPPFLVPPPANFSVPPPPLLSAHPPAVTNASLLSPQPPPSNALLEAPSPQPSAVAAANPAATIAALAAAIQANSSPGLPVSSVWNK